MKEVYWVVDNESSMQMLLNLGRLPLNKALRSALDPSLSFPGSGDQIHPTIDPLHQTRVPHLQLDECDGGRISFSSETIPPKTQPSDPASGLSISLPPPICGSLFLLADPGIRSL